MNGLRVDKNISLGHIITTILLFVSVITWGLRLENEVENKADLLRVASLESEIKQAKIRLDAAEEINRIERINLEEKVDSLSQDIREMKRLLLQVIEDSSKREK